MLQFEGDCWAISNMCSRVSLGTDSGRKPRIERLDVTASIRGMDGLTGTIVFSGNVRVVVHDSNFHPHIEKHIFYQMYTVIVCLRRVVLIVEIVESVFVHSLYWSSQDAKWAGKSCDF